MSPRDGLFLRQHRVTLFLDGIAQIVDGQIVGDYFTRQVGIPVHQRPHAARDRVPRAAAEDENLLLQLGQLLVEMYSHIW